MKAVVIPYALRNPVSTPVSGWKLRLQGFSGAIMRSIERFSERELTQIALQTANLVELSTIYANFGDFPQRCHSDAALPQVELVTIRFPFPSSVASAYCQLSQLVNAHTRRSTRPARADRRPAKSSRVDTQTRNRRIEARNSST